MENADSSCTWAAVSALFRSKPSCSTNSFPKRSCCRSPMRRRPEGFDAWNKTNVYKQRQAGYATVTVALPLGDITADQLRALADLARKYVKETIRTTVEQNIVMRWVSEADLPALYSELKEAG